jgi:hypothetical protein
MTRRTVAVLLGWPLVPAALAVLLLINSDAVPIACPPSPGLGRSPLSTCLPTLLPTLTWADPVLVWLSWAAVAVLVYIGLVGWSLFLRRRASGWAAAPGIRRSVLLVVPAVLAVGSVAYLLGGDGILHFCPIYREPLFPANACLPTLFHALTGSDLLVITVSWAVVAATIYVALLGWSLALDMEATR